MLNKYVYAVRISPEFVEVRESYEPLQLKVTKLTTKTKTWDTTYTYDEYLNPVPRRVYSDVPHTLKAVSLTGGEVIAYIKQSSAVAIGLEVGLDKAIRVKGRLAENLLSAAWRRANIK